MEQREKNDNSKTFSKLLSIATEGYDDLLVESIPFSVRVSNRIRSGGINTVADLLNSTPNDLLKIRGLGENSIKEVEEYLKNLPPSREIIVTKKNACSRNDVKFLRVIYENRERIINGDFSFINQDSINETEAVKDYIAAYDSLEPEIVRQCYYETEQIMSIIDMLELQYAEYIQQKKLLNIVKNLPGDRKNKLARGYIKAYRKNEEKRELLNSFCLNDDDTLFAMCLNCKNTTEDEYNELINFFNWCKFDLNEDIDKVISSLFSSERNRIVIQMRANNQTLEQVGQVIGVTRERVRQIEAKAKWKFSRLQSQLKLISKISAERNDDTILTIDEIRPFCREYTEILVYLLKDYNSPNYTYDKNLEVFILSNDSLQEQVLAYVDALPDVILLSDFAEIIESAEEEELPSELVERAIQDAYKLTGSVYHREKLTLVKIYEDILKKHYPNGIKVYEHEELMDFRQRVYEIYGDVNLPKNDRAITARITDIGILCDKGMYRPKTKQYISNELADKIYSFIMDTPNDIILMNILFEVFESQLIAEGVNNKYYLQGILHELYDGKLFFKRDYVSKSADSASFYTAIVDFIKSYAVPVTKQQIQTQFPGITDIVISLATNDEKVLNYFGEYYYAEYLNISTEEKKYLDNLLQTMTSDNKAHHVKEIYEIVMKENPSIFRRNAAMYPHSAFSILEYLFREMYEFSRPYIAKHGLQIEKSGKQMRDFIYGKEYLTVSDIKDYAQEIYYVIYSTISFVDSFNDEYFWLDKDSIVRIDQTGITKSIAQQIEEYLLESLSETMPIANALPHYHLPYINVEWSDWLIYSVLKKWGTKVEVDVTSAQLRYAVPVVAPLGKLDTSKYENLKPADIVSTIKVDNLDTIDDIDDLIVSLIEDDIQEDDDEF